MQIRFFFTVVLILATSCGIFDEGEKHRAQPNTPSPNENSREEGGGETDVSDAGVRLLAEPLLFFTGVDLKFQSSASYALNLTSKAVTKIADGDSGDPIFFRTDAGLLFFNRSQGNRNMRRVYVRDGAYARTEQIAYTAGRPGDPHDVVAVDKNTAVAANYVKGNLVVFRLDDGATVAEITADWDIPSGDGFRPEKLFWHRTDGVARLFVLHQGLDQSYQPNGSQQLFVVEYREGAWQPQDLDPNKPRLQGIPLSASSPFGFSRAQDDSIYIAGLCYPGAPSACVAATERVNKASLTHSVTGSLMDKRWGYNGQMAFDYKTHTFFAAIVDASGRSKAVSFDLSGQSSRTEHTFAQREREGYWGLFFDHGEKQLFVSSYKSATQGWLSVMQQGQVTRKIELDAIPYNGVVTGRD